MTEQKIRILIADDMEAHRRRLERVIAQSGTMECVAGAASGYEAAMQAAMHHPDVILLDIEMESQYAGIEAAKQINEKLPHIKIIVLTVHKDDNFIFAAFQTGINDYLLKTATNEEIIEAIRSAYHNQSPIRPMIAEKIREEFARVKRTESSLLFVIQIISDLTPSELQVLRQLCEGKSRKTIAEERSVEYETIKKQINSILKKFKLPSISDVIRSVNELRIFEALKKL
ncbi:response regulator [Paenibacillus allorhizosphaerae]|uniref:Transcriptional regulatory protein DegU n=1 Tax=Paenibacillus allorhizosphaerae TaxID=2849866 RepID=A0ABM8VD82_9BACL|nr:response regulator transcription factor [Paenibacillus allorhizosphaerae]CAG7626734.1 Transcriptional regulatory protein DegU [Paenibacillus allorhizosphaerae]